jgi:O-antigen ligase
MAGFSRPAHFNHLSLATYADWAAVAVAVALPWSTSAVGVAIAVWLVMLLPSLDGAAVKRGLATAAGGLPVLLWCLGVIGMLWADVDWHQRLAGLNSFHRLLAIPLLLAQFRRSDNGIAVVCGFLISSITVLLASYTIIVVFGDEWPRIYGVPVHDTIFQGSEFLICGFGAIGYAVLTWGRSGRRWSIALVAIGVLFLINFAVATASRSALVIAPVLLLLLGWRLYRWKGALVAGLVGITAGGLMWFASPVLRDRLERTLLEIRAYRTMDQPMSVGEHAAFLKESVVIIASAPIIGHGTGSIGKEFAEITAGKTGTSGTGTVNPHNQTFAVAIQLGLVGALVLWAMWIAHIGLFSGACVIAWLGLILVTENILSSAVHSHLFDFNSGWLYVFGVGVLGGTMLRQRDNISKKPAFGDANHMT